MSNPYPVPSPLPPPVPPGVPGRRPDPMPVTEVEFHQMFRNRTTRWWKGLLAVLTFCVAYFVISNLLAVVAFAIDAATGRLDVADLQAGRIQLTPAVLLATNVGNLLAIPVSMLLQRAFFGQPVRWAHSVAGAFRWRLLGRTAVVVVPVWLVMIGGLSLLGPRGEQPFTGESIALLVIVLITTPLQSAGEEYGARGFITRATGTWAADPRVALIISTAVSAAIFAVAHAAADPWLIVYYAFFGVTMSVIVWRTGGLEVSSLLHAVNNVVSFGVIIVAGQSLTIDRSAGTGGPAILLPMALLAGVAAYVWWWAGNHDVQRTYRPVDPTTPPGPGVAQSSSDPAQLPGEPPR